MLLELLRNKKVRALPWRFKLFMLRYFLSIRNPDNMQEIDGKKVLSIYLPPFPSEAFDTFLDAQVKASRGVPVPEIVNISLTTGCDNDCWHCCTPGERVDIDHDMILETIKTLKEMGTFQFLFTGGNPMLRDDLEELVKATGNSSLALVSTPGPVSRQRARSLKKAGCQGVLVALEHYDEKKNDSTMDCQGAYGTSLESIKNIRDSGMLTGTWIVVTSDKISDLDIYLKFVKVQGVSDVAIFEPILVHRKHLLKDKHREYLLNIQKISKKKKGYPRIISGPFMDSEEFMGCTAGYNRLHINAHGEVYPCDMLHESWGNINRQDIKDIWEQMNANHSRPICGCLALDKVEQKMPAYYRCLIRKSQ
ncbi:MAG: radical SAM protein [Thermoplasmata archaeon]